MTGTFERFVAETWLTNEVRRSSPAFDSVNSIVPDMRTAHFTVDLSMTSTTVVCAAQNGHGITSDNKASTNLFAIAVSPPKFSQITDTATPDNLSASFTTRAAVRATACIHSCDPQRRSWRNTPIIHSNICCDRNLGITIYA